MSQHRVVFAESFYALLDIFHGNTHSLSHFFLTLQVMRNKLVQRRVEQADSYRITSHYPEDSLEVVLLVRQNLIQCFLTTLGILSQNHLTHGFNLLALEEHVFRTAKSDSDGTESACDRSIVRRIGVRTNFQASMFVGQVHQFLEVVGQFSSFRLYLADIDFTCRTVQRNEIAFLQRNTIDFDSAVLIVHIQSTSS